VLFCDATFKMVWQGFPVLVVETVEKSHQFQHIGIAVASLQLSNAENFLFFFQAVQSGVLDIFSVNMDPKYVIADAAQAIFNCFPASFPNGRVIMCWPNAKKNKVAKVRKLCEKQDLKQISEGISKLNLAKAAE
jgi:MULE transposase domain